MTRTTDAVADDISEQQQVKDVSHTQVHLDTRDDNHADDQLAPLNQVNNNSSSNNNNNNTGINHNNTNSSSTSGSIVDSERRYRPQKYCAVCGDKAIACNFNAVTCESCKAFFRRNAFKDQRLKCLFDNRCIIDRVTRRFCSKCRLLKCFQIGMRREWILTDEQKQIKRVKIMQNKQSRLQNSSSPSQSGEDSPQCQPGIDIKSTSSEHHPNEATDQADRSQPTVDSRQSTKISATTTTTNIRSPKVKQARVPETRDAATLCPDEFDLLNPNNHSIHYCSMASQCQYCSLRLTTGCSPPSHQPAIDYYHHHHQHNQHMIQQQQVVAMQMRVPSVVYHSSPPSGHESLQHLGAYPAVASALEQQHANSTGGPPMLIGGGQTSTSTATACCCLDPPADTTSNQFSHQFNNRQQSSIIMADQQQVGHQANSNNNSNNNDTTGQPQLHVMTPPQMAHMIESDSGAGVSSMFGGSQFSTQHLTTNQNANSASSPVGVIRDFASPTNYGQQQQQQQQYTTPTTRNINPFVMALEARPLRSPGSNQQRESYNQSSSGSAMQVVESSGGLLADTNNKSSQALNRTADSSKTPTSPTTTTTPVKLESRKSNGGGTTMISAMISANEHRSTNKSINLSSEESGSGSGGQLVVGAEVVDKSGYVVWNGQVYRRPAHTETEVRERAERLEFHDTERQLIFELIEATRFMFEHTQNDNYKYTGNSLNYVIHFCDAALRRLIKTVKQVKAFRMLSMDDQIVLLKTACFKILLLRSTFHYHDEFEGWIDSKTGKVLRLDILTEAKKSLVYERHLALVKKIPEPLRKDRLIMAIMSLALLFDPSTDLKHSNSVGLDNLIYLSILRKYLTNTQPDPLTKYESLVAALEVINACNEEYNVFFSKDFQPEQITPLLIEIFDISMNNSL